jgi:hypothetical protein
MFFFRVIFLGSHGHRFIGSLAGHAREGRLWSHKFRHPFGYSLRVRNTLYQTSLFSAADSPSNFICLKCLRVHYTCVNFDHQRWYLCHRSSTHWGSHIRRIQRPTGLQYVYRLFYNADLLSMCIVRFLYLRACRQFPHPARTRQQMGTAG